MTVDFRSVLTASECARYDRIMAALAVFHDAGPAEEKAAYQAILSLIPDISPGVIEELYGSMSDDEFAWGHAIEVVHDPGSENTQRCTIELALSYRGCDGEYDFLQFEYLVHRHQVCFERLYGIPTGMFREVLSNSAVTAYDEFSIAMKRLGPIRL